MVSLTMGRLVGKEVMFKLEQSIMDSWLCLIIHDDDHENNDEDDEDDDEDVPVEGAAALVGAGFRKRVRGERTD